MEVCAAEEEPVQAQEVPRARKSRRGRRSRSLPEAATDAARARRTFATPKRRKQGEEAWVMKKSIGMRVQRREDSGVGRVEVRPRDWVERRGREAPGLGERGAPRLGEMTCRRGCRASSPKLPSAPLQRRKEWAAPVVRNPVRWRVRTWSPTGSPPMAAGGAGSGRAGCCRGGTIADEAGRHGGGRRRKARERAAPGASP